MSDCVFVCNCNNRTIYFVLLLLLLLSRRRWYSHTHSETVYSLLSIGGVLRSTYSIYYIHKRAKLEEEKQPSQLTQQSVSVVIQSWIVRWTKPKTFANISNRFYKHFFSPLTSLWILTHKLIPNYGDLNCHSSLSSPSPSPSTRRSLWKSVFVLLFIYFVLILFQMTTSTHNNQMWNRKSGQYAEKL